MLKSLLPNFTWENIKAIGFDLDGTLYPEEEFIAQAYLTISDLFSISLRKDKNAIYAFLMRRWREKGSSYPYLFREALEEGNLSEASIQEEIQKALNLFRGFEPKLSLGTEIKALLDASQLYELFLVTDGQSSLQRSKIHALGLSHWFSPEQIAISGDFGPQSQKPSTEMLSHLKLKTQDPSQVVYLGDRDRDALFAKNAGFQFILFSLRLDDNGSRMPPIIQLPFESKHTPESQNEGQSTSQRENN